MSFSPRRVYAFDIETNTDGVNGLDPREARITEVVVSTHDRDEVFVDDDETKLMFEFNRFVESLPTGLLVGWNSTFFDIPFIWSRWHGVDGAGVEFMPWEQTPRHKTGWDLGMHPIQQPDIKPKYQYLPGYTTGLTCLWRSRSNLRLDLHQHADVSFPFKAFAEAQGIRHRLKTVCRAKGIPMFDATGKPYEDPNMPGEVDRSKMHLMSDAERFDYVVSDGRGTRALALDWLGVA